MADAIEDCAAYIKDSDLYKSYCSETAVPRRMLAKYSEKLSTIAERLFNMGQFFRPVMFCRVHVILLQFYDWDPSAGSAPGRDR